MDCHFLKRWQWNPVIRAQFILHQNMKVSPLNVHYSIQMYLKKSLCHFNLLYLSLITNNCRRFANNDGTVSIRAEIGTNVESGSLCLHDNFIIISHDFHIMRFESHYFAPKDASTHLTLRREDRGSHFSQTAKAGYKFEQ